MTSDIMIEWLKSGDRQMKKKGRKILLFLDNAPSHPSVNLENVKLAFLPANTTSLAQPMDQGIIHALKFKYRRRQLKYILTQMERSDKVGSDILKGISVLDAIYWIHASWKEVESSTIQNCFLKCGFNVDLLGVDNNSDSEWDDDDEVPLAMLRLSRDLFGFEFPALVEIDKSVQTCDENPTNWESNARDVLTGIRKKMMMMMRIMNMKVMNYIMKMMKQ